MSVNIIGGADGPTSIFISEKIGPSWINFFGLVIMVIIMIPNIIYAFKFRGVENKCKSKFMNIIEQIGRYGSMFFMIFNIGLFEFGFSSIESFIIYFVGNIILVIAYWIVWIQYFKKVTLWKSFALAIIPTVIFLVSGLTLRHYLLVLSSIVFGIGHIFVTYQKTKDNNFLLY